ncbi:uncharacterized protein LOC124357213 [Homalodisca vitripennis]|uniref:uncharacterized protein LOC124357213 n=1 Tax=Homalodisca vitripennis TaxID=197043 RepID=UPI001EEB3D5A|nr:uncharacterized protein LOC124357213 [Homalodisca vitripennis]
MTLVAGRIPSLPLLQRNHYGEDGSMQGILKTTQGTTRRFNKGVKTVNSSYVDQEFEHGQRNDDGRRLVRFCETQDSEKLQKSGRNSTDADDQDVIMFGNNLYILKNSDPNSAVRKLFPNSKLTPINPSISRSNVKDNNPNHFVQSKNHGSNQNISVRSKLKCDNIDVSSRISPVKRTDRSSILRKNMGKSSPETKPKPGKNNELSTPLIERIKQLTCDSEDSIEVKKESEKERTCDSLFGRKITDTESKRVMASHESKNHHKFPPNIKDLPKQAKEGLNLMRYNQNILQTRSHLPTEKPTSPSNKTNLTDEARRSFLSSLSQGNDGEPGDRTSVATSSTTADTVYSLSDIEEVLTEEEKEIKDAFSQQNKQDELELFVQQDAGRTERLRKRYSSTPKPEFSSSSFHLKSTDNLSVPYFTNPCNSNFRKEKPKFGSTIEILQQLQQQIETPYQLEGRRTACSNYSDSSIPISERLFCDESSDGYEPVLPKLNVHRTCSLDSKNYEEIEHFPSAFSVPRTKSHEHPRMAHFESEPYVYHSPCLRYSGNFNERNQGIEQNVYASSPDLHSYHRVVFPNRMPSYNNHPINVRQLHPVLQKQYCRYPVNEQPSRPAEEGKVLTPPSRMHTYMNVPSNAPCYLMPPPYQFPKINHYPSPPSYPNEYHFDTPFAHSNIYQNVPLPHNPHVGKAVGRLCTERERGVPEGASSHDSKEINHNDFYFSNMPSIPRQPSVPHHYCVDV